MTTLKGIVEAEKLRSASERLAAVQIMSSVSTSSGLDKTQEIFCQTRSKFSNQVREELFASNTRKRIVAGDDESSQDAVLKYNEEMQEKVAKEMIDLAHNFKQNLQIASHIIKKDTQVLESTSRHADDNINSLRTNSEKLADFVRRSCQYWLWISLALVCASFLWMVVFIRMFPKKTY